MNNKFIFLDFDGVLHSNSGKRFHCLEYFSDVIHKLDNVKIVFSTSWREYTPFEKLVELMPSRIQDKCFGSTPVLNNAGSHPRYKEILMFNENHQILKTDWIALDDMACLFPPNCENLLLIDSKKGFQKHDAIQLKQRLINKEELLKKIKI